MSLQRTAAADVVCLQETKLSDEPFGELLGAELADRGYDPVYGARPLRRYISHEIETRLGRALLSGQVMDGSTVTLDVQDGDLVFNIAAPAEEEDAG